MRLPRIGVLSGVLALVLAVTGLPPLFGQDAGGGDGPSAHLASAGFEPREVRAGGEAKLRIEISIAEGSHLYAQSEGAGKAPEFTWTLPDGWTAGALRDVSEPHEFTGFGDKEMVHEGTLVLEQTFTLTAGAAAGPATVTGVAEWQVCDAQFCAFGKDVPLSATATVLAAPPDAGGAQEGETHARIVSARFDPAEAPRGGEAKLRIELAIDPTWHLYAQSEGPEKAPAFDWDLPEGWKAGALRDVSTPHEFTGFGEPEQVHEGKLVLEQTFSVGPAAKLGDVPVTGSGAWQACDPSVCVFATDVPVLALAKVVAAAAGGAGPVAPAAGAAGTGAPVAPANGMSWASVLGQALLWGFVTCLTPCVFPLLPVTVSFFSKQKGPALPRATVYALGIVFTITVIGLVFKSGLDVMARGWVFNALVGVLFLGLALSLFGLFDLRLPSFLTNWASRKGSEGGGLAGPFFMAVTLALTSFSCSMPFLAVMFTQFERGNATQAVTGLVVYGSTMALPFFLCSLFPSALSALPRAGEWMQAVKVTMGFVEFALAFKFFRTVALNFGSDALPRGFVLALWAACAIGAAFYLFGWIVLPHDTKPESIGVIRLVFALGFLGSAIYLVNGVNGRPLADWLEGFIQTQPKEIAAAGGGGGGESGGHIPWGKNDWDGALKQSRETGRPVLFDFTGVG